MPLSSLLEGKVVVVVGGCTGHIGSGAVRGLLKLGATVVVPATTEEKRQRLLTKHMALSERLHGFVANVELYEDALKLRSFVHKTFGRVDHVVSALGSHWQKGLTTNQSVEEFYRSFTDLCGKHFITAKAFLPYLGGIEKGGDGDGEMAYNAAASEEGDLSYTLLTGREGERCVVPEAGLFTVGSAALHGLSMALRAEAHVLRERERERRRKQEDDKSTTMKAGEDDKERAAEGEKGGISPFARAVRFNEVRVGVRVMEDDKVNAAVPIVVGESKSTTVSK